MTAIDPPQHAFFYTMPKGRKWDQVGKWPSGKVKGWKPSTKSKRRGAAVLQMDLASILLFLKHNNGLFTLVIDEVFDDKFIVHTQTGYFLQTGEIKNTRKIYKFDTKNIGERSSYNINEIGYWNNLGYHPPYDK